MKTIELFKKVELYIQNDSSYKECIGTGHIAERFNKLLIELTTHDLTDLDQQRDDYYNRPKLLEH